MAQLELKDVTLETVCAGAAAELFQEEFRKVVADIADVNKKATAARSVTLTFTIKPFESREEAAITLQPSHTLAKLKPATGAMFLDGKGRAVTHDTQQGDVFEKGHDVVDTGSGEVIAEIRPEGTNAE